MYISFEFMKLQMFILLTDVAYILGQYMLNISKNCSPTNTVAFSPMGLVWKELLFLSLSIACRICYGIL